MFDSCVLFEEDNDFLKKLKVIKGNAKIKNKLIFNSNDLVFFEPKTEEELKQAIKQTLPFGIINAELIHRKDSIHFIKSGIDDSTAKEMGKKKIALVFNLNLLILKKDYELSLILRRMKENMKKAVKHDIPVLFASCAKNKYELFNGMQIKAWANYLGIDDFNRVKLSFNKIF